MIENNDRCHWSPPNGHPQKGESPPYPEEKHGKYKTNNNGR